MIGGSLSNLTKQELLRRIRKYEDKSGTKSKISMKHKKEVMIEYLERNVPKKEVRFAEEVQIIPIKGRTSLERNTRKKALKKIGKSKKENRKIRNIRHKDIPELEKYLEIKKHNLSSKKLKKKEPMKFIRGIDSEDKKRVLYNQKKWKQHKIKYNLVEKENKVILKIYEKERDVKKESIKKEFKFNPEKSLDKYRAEYDAKVYLIKLMRKKIAKK